MKENYTIKEIIELIERFKVEELHDRNNPYHFEAEIASGLIHFENWLKTKIEVQFKVGDKLEASEFDKGYTQCQEDMAKDVEYWQGEFDHWHQQAMDMSNKYNELLNKQD